MYAIVRTGGKQYRVEEGRSVTVERLPAAEGETVELTDVLLIENDGDVTVGAPLIEGARVLAEVETIGRGKKIIVFKYKSKVRARKKTGHRQNFTKLSVVEILAPGQESQGKKSRIRRPVSGEDAVAAAEPEAVIETPAVEAPKRRRAAPEAVVAVEAPEAEAVIEAPAVEAPKRRRAAPKKEPEAKPSRGRKAPEAKPKAAKAPEAKSKAAPKAKAKDEKGPKGGKAEKKDEKPKGGKAEKKDEKPKTRRGLSLRRKKDTEK